MSRPRKHLDEKSEGDKVCSTYKIETTAWKRERLLAIKLGLEGNLSLEEIAVNLDRSRATIQTWFDTYRKGGD